MNEQRQNEIKALLQKHHLGKEKKAPPTQNKELSLSNITGNNNNFYINSYIEGLHPKKN